MSVIVESARASGYLCSPTLPLALSQIQAVTSIGTFKKVRHRISLLTSRTPKAKRWCSSLVSRGDDEWTKTFFGTLKRASQFIDVLIDKRQEDSWEALIEALTPDLPLTSNRMIEAKMFAQTMKEILESDDFAKATDVAEIAHVSKRNPSSQPNRWKKTGLIFAVPYKGVDLYPLYALELRKGAKPLPIMKKVLQVLAEKDDWQKAFWFGSVNTYLRNKMPKELLKSKPQEVLRAAEIEASGVQHG